MKRTLGLLVLAISTAACTATAAGPDEAVEQPGVELPQDWDTRSAYAFERWLEESFAPDAVTPLSTSALDAATAVLADQNPTALRAALVLARSRSPEAGTRLIESLEARRPVPERAGDAADVIAAAALVHFPDAATTWRPRLERLAVGSGAHPDLEVRVECACAALALGSDAPIPFLLQVVRITTAAGEGDERDFEVSPTTTWARTQAANALSVRAGVEPSYVADASLEHRQREAERLAELLGR